MENKENMVSPENMAHNNVVTDEEDGELSSLFEKFKSGSYFNVKDDQEETEEKDRVLKEEAPLDEKDQVELSKEKEVVSDSNDSNDSKEDDNDQEDKQSEIKKVDELSLKLDKTTKRLQESQKWGNDLRVKLSAYEKKIKRFQEEGTISEDEAAELLKDTYIEADEEDAPLLVKYGRIWDSEVENIRRYSDDSDIDQSISAFQHFLQNAPRKDIDSVFAKFEKLADDPVRFTKAMLEIGKKYNEEVYKEIVEVGGIKGLKNKYNEEIEKYKKNIDKLEKEILKLKKRYEDYTESNYRLPNSSSTIKESDFKLDDADVASIFKAHKSGKKVF